MSAVSSAMAGLQQSIGALPGVIAVAMASHLPRTSPTQEPMELEGRTLLTPTPVVGVGPGLFSVLEIQPILGRAIEEGDLLPDAPSVAVVNEAFAQESFGTTQILGRRLRLAPPAGQDAPNPWREIVGVVPNVMEVTGSGRAAGVYLPLTPQRFLSLAVLVDGDPLAFAAPIRQAAYDLDPELNIFDLVRLDDVGAENRTVLVMMSTGLMGIGIVALLLSLAGVYSIVSLTVTQRAREIGVRVALGATPMSVLWSVLRGLGVLVLLGAAVGAPAGSAHPAGGGAAVRFVTPDEEPSWTADRIAFIVGPSGSGAGQPLPRSDSEKKVLGRKTPYAPYHQAILAPVHQDGLTLGVVLPEGLEGAHILGVHDQGILHLYRPEAS